MQMNYKISLTLRQTSGFIATGLGLAAQALAAKQSHANAADRPL